MHFAYPARKNSNPPRYLPRTSPRLPTLRRRHLKPIALLALGVFALLWLLSGRGGGGRGGASRAGSRGLDTSAATKAAERKIPGKPPVVLVTVFHEKSDNAEYIKNIKDNRLQYAEKHGEFTTRPLPHPFSPWTFGLWALAVGLLGQVQD